VCPYCPLLFNIVLEFLARAIRQQEEIKRNTNRKRRSQTIPNCRGHDLTLKRPKNSTSKLLNARNRFSKVEGYKVN
jgi:hypothetical protein